MEMLSAIKKLHETIKGFQSVLTQYITPDSGMEEKFALDQLIAIADNKELIEALETVIPSLGNFLELPWPTSGNIAKTKYFPETRILEITFKNNASYRYFGFSHDAYEGMIKAPSIGKFFYAQIDKKLSYEKIN